MSAPPPAAPGWAPWPRSRTARRIVRSPRIIAGCIGILIVVTMALAPALFSGTDPRAQNLRTRFVPPVWADAGQPAYPLGTDRLGRDVWSRTVHAARISVTVGLSAMLAAGLLGTALGVISGYYRGWVDTVIMRLADVQLGIPPLLLVIAVAGVLGPSLLNVILILSVSGWVIYARTARGMVLSLREQEFVQGARALGASDPRIIVRHLVPNIVLPIIVIASQQMALMILRESTLSFLGIGVPPHIPTWGSIIADGRVVIGYAPWISLVPGIVLLVTVLSVNFLGDGLRDALDTQRNV
jgi:peptide/nickel transport system permease protein